MFSNLREGKKKMSTIFISYHTSVLWVGEIFGFCGKTERRLLLACMVTAMGEGGAEYLPVFPSH